jgi:hypothetical protein
MARIETHALTDLAPVKTEADRDQGSNNVTSGPPAQIEQDPPIQREATTGNVVAFPHFASTSRMAENADSASASRIPATHTIKGFLGISGSRIWRAKLYVRNSRYPRVTTVGCYFIEHSAGFQLIHRETHKYLGHYTKAAIAELEKKYGKAKARNRRRK